MLSTLSRRRCRRGTMTGSNVESRSRGTSITTGSTVMSPGASCTRTGQSNLVPGNCNARLCITAWSAPCDKSVPPATTPPWNRFRLQRNVLDRQRSAHEGTRCPIGQSSAPDRRAARATNTANDRPRGLRPSMIPPWRTGRPRSPWSARGVLGAVGPHRRAARWWQVARRRQSRLEGRRARFLARCVRALRPVCAGWLVHPAPARPRAHPRQAAVQQDRRRRRRVRRRSEHCRAAQGRGGRVRHVAGEAEDAQQKPLFVSTTGHEPAPAAELAAADPLRPSWQRTVGPRSKRSRWSSSPTTVSPWRITSGIRRRLCSATRTEVSSPRRPRSGIRNSCSV